ncbi:MAG: hypothetical protein KAR54_00275 [Candidatus Pacebacteria bacterium]|nr:hypothetical protein [Candidatus Paceibacterota bacterium]
MKIKFKKNKKYLLPTIISIVSFSVLIFLIVQQNDKEIVFVPENEVNFQSVDEYNEYYDALIMAYKKDNFGGDTPEETINGLVEALKLGDVELASKYFVVEKQKRVAEELAIGKENGVLGLLIGDLTKENEGFEMLENEYRFRTFDENNIAEFSFDLILNEYTNKWKIESL